MAQAGQHREYLSVVASRRYSNVFRLTAVMREAVDPALLQQALEQTLPYFAAFNVRLRHGLFWNYLETNRATPQVLPEQDAPAAISTPWRQAAFCSVCCITAAACASGDLPRAHGRHGRDAVLKAVCYRYCQLAHPDAFTPEQLATLRHRDRGRGARTDTSSITFRPKAKRSANRARIICGASTASRAGWAWPRR